MKRNSVVLYWEVIPMLSSASDMWWRASSSWSLPHSTTSCQELARCTGCWPLLTHSSPAQQLWPQLSWCLHLARLTPAAPPACPAHPAISFKYSNHANWKIAKNSPVTFLIELWNLVIVCWMWWWCVKAGCEADVNWLDWRRRWCRAESGVSGELVTGRAGTLPAQLCNTIMF